jgi:CYTH domain-containing protein
VGDRAFLTIKGAQHGASRYEYEYGIPIRDATEMLERLCERPLIEKTRHHLTVGGREWVVDEFEGENAGLMIAEVEFEKEGQRSRCRTGRARKSPTSRATSMSAWSGIHTGFGHQTNAARGNE